MQAQPESSRERYARLIAAAQSNQCVWIAESAESTLILPNESGEELIPVWPSEEEASAVLAGLPNLSGFRPVPRSLDRWLTLSTPHLIEDGILIGACPDCRMACLMVPAADFGQDLAPAPRLQASDLSRLRKKLVARRPRGGA
ncbi:DUF2750 domain-containing protein [Lysobacter sp. A3-1-A15]|uniref:DUF2750 domain-containing protein n=1 Tax=Novilysobacter viscosus TaxID=3098602 RepID=UPI003983BE80